MFIEPQLLKNCKYINEMRIKLGESSKGFLSFLNAHQENNIYSTKKLKLLKDKYRLKEKNILHELSPFRTKFGEKSNLVSSGNLNVLTQNINKSFTLNNSYFIKSNITNTFKDSDYFSKNCLSKSVINKSRLEKIENITNTHEKAKNKINLLKKKKNNERNYPSFYLNKTKFFTSNMKSSNDNYKDLHKLLSFNAESEKYNLINHSVNSNYKCFKKNQYQAERSFNFGRVNEISREKNWIFGTNINKDFEREFQKSNKIFRILKGDFSKYKDQEIISNSIKRTPLIK